MQLLQCSMGGLVRFWRQRAVRIGNWAGTCRGRHPQGTTRWVFPSEIWQSLAFSGLSYADMLSILMDAHDRNSEGRW